MTDRKRTTSRRDVLAGFGFFAGIAVAAPGFVGLAKAAQGAEDAKWRDFIEQFAFLHPNGRAAAERARAAGMNPAELSGVTLHSDQFPAANLPILWFGAWREGKHYFSVTPHMCGEYRRVHRGAGPCIIPPAGKAVRA